MIFIFPIIMKINTSIFSTHQLSDEALEFLEQIQWKEWELARTDRFDRMSLFTENPNVVKEISDADHSRGFSTIKLNKPLLNNKNQNGLIKLNNDRNSERIYLKKNIISKQEFSNFMSMFYTITSETNITKNLVIKKRNIASGGGIYSNDIYIIIKKIEDIEEGIYHYNVHKESIEFIKKYEDLKLQKYLFCENNSMVDYENSNAIIIICPIFNKHTVKYKNFGIVLSLIETGSLIQSAYLAATNLKLGTCAYGGMLNKKLREYLEINNPLQIPLIYITLGKIE